jgi:hypothetical protein
MADVSPGVALGTFVGGIVALLKLAGEIIKYRNAKRLKDAEKSIGPSIRPPPMPPPPPTLTYELQVQAKHVELLRAQYQIDTLTVKLAEASRREAELSARVTEQELLNRQLVDEMARLRREGGHHGVEPVRDRPRGVHGGHRGGEPVPRDVRPPRRPGGGEAR